MSAIIESTLPALAFEITMKSLVLLTVVLSVTWFMRRSSAALRHLYFTIASIALVALPLGSVLLPSWNPGFFPDRFGSIFMPATLTSPEADRQSRPGPGFSEESGADGASTGILSTGGRTPRTWLHWFFVLWLAGAALLLLGLFVGKVYGYLAAGRAHVVEDEEFLAALEEARQKAGLTRRIVVLESQRFKVPSVTGILNPKLLVPPQAVFWPRDRLEAVLQHELSHIKRNDILVQFLGQVACCIYWLNPLAWILERKLFIERERACDDIALGQDVKASEYAGHLMEVLEEMGNSRNTLWVTAAMAEGTDFKDRILSVLNPVAKRTSPRKGHLLAAAAVALLALLPLSALRPWTTEAAEQIIDRPGTAITGSYAAQDNGSSDVVTGDDRVRTRDDRIQDRMPISVLIEQLKSPSAVLRERAAWTLGESRDRKAALPLIEALGDENASVREHVATALGKLGEKRAVLPLCDLLLNDTNRSVREHAASALGVLGDDRAYQPLLKAMQSDPDDDVRLHAINALQKLREGR